MGTRNLTCVVHDKKIKVAKYCQWDGYPEGQGIIILDFLREKFNKELFIQELGKTKKATKKDIISRWKEFGVSAKSDLVSIEASDLFNAKYPFLHRNMGGAILEAIQNGEVDILDNDTEFAKDSLFCEWGYVVDLDKETFEVYRGYNKEPLSKDARFYSKDQPEEPPKYYPIKISQTYKLCNLPSNETFLKDLTGKE